MIRSISEHELDQLRPAQVTFTKLVGHYVLGFIFPFMIILLPIALLSNRVEWLNGMQIPMIIVAAILSVFATGYLNRFNYSQYQVGKLINRETRVKEDSFDVSESMKVEEFEDEGVGFFFRLPDKRTLFLQGQYLYDFDGKEYFSGNKITTIRLEENDEIIDCIVTGERVPISLSRVPFTERELKNDEYYEDGTVIDKCFDELKGSFIKHELRSS